MSTQLAGTHPAEPHANERDLREAVIAERVLSLLGEPENLHTVQVRALYDGKYRVNVFVRADCAFRVAHSYFLQTDDDGAILASSPPIVRQY